MKKLLATALLGGSLALINFAHAGEVKGVDESAAIDQQLGMRLAPGFKAEVFADGLGFLRHVVMSDDGVLYASLYRPKDGYGLVALKDTNGDHQADVVEYFGQGMSGTGIGIHDGYLYFSTPVEVMRWKLNSGDVVPSGDKESMVTGFLQQRSHRSKPFTFDDAGNIYVNIGAPSNACQEQARSKGSPGMMPCPQLRWQGGIWRFDANKPGQTLQDDGYHYSTGIRNAMSLDWNHASNALFFASHGRDSLADLWGYSNEDSAELPSEEFHMASDGSNHGWPYTFWDHRQGKRMKAPEYGGQQGEEDSNDKYAKPKIGFPGHWAPNDLLFVKGDGLPEGYQGGAFLAFHGSWNRAPLYQKGYKIVYMPFKDGQPTGEWSVFADGFAGTFELKSPGDAKHRPMGLAEGDDGALYVTSSVSGRIWRITKE